MIQMHSLSVSPNIPLTAHDFHHIGEGLINTSEYPYLHHVKTLPKYFRNQKENVCCFIHKNHISPIIPDSLL